jgi:uncharacterized protein (TIGR03067 family)
MKRCLPILLLVGFVVAADAPSGDKTKAEMKKLEGTWKVVSLELAGKPLPPEKARLGLLIIKGDKLTLTERGKDAKGGKTMTFKIDPTKKPKTLDLRITRGEESVDWKCIYSLKADELKICMPLARKKGEKGPANTHVRPDSFETAGKPLMLITAKREAGKE